MADSTHGVVVTTKKYLQYERCSFPMYDISSDFNEWSEDVLNSASMVDCEPEAGTFVSFNEILLTDIDVLKNRDGGTVAAKAARKAVLSRSSRKLCGLLRSLVGSRLCSQIFGGTPSTDAYAYWNLLKAYSGDDVSIAANSQQLTEAFHTAVFPSQGTWLSRFNEFYGIMISYQLKLQRHPVQYHVTDANFVSQVLSKLPSEYLTLKLNITTHTNHDTQKPLLKSLGLTMSQQLDKYSDSSEIAGVITDMSQVECWQCGNKGHRKSDCRSGGNGRGGGRGNRGRSGRGRGGGRGRGRGGRGNGTANQYASKKSNTKLRKEFDKQKKDLADLKAMIATGTNVVNNTVTNPPRQMPTTTTIAGAVFELKGGLYVPVNFYSCVSTQQLVDELCLSTTLHSIAIIDTGCTKSLCGNLDLVSNFIPGGGSKFTGVGGTPIDSLGHGQIQFDIPWSNGTTQTVNIHVDYVKCPFTLISTQSINELGIDILISDGDMSLLQNNRSFSVPQVTDNLYGIPIVNPNNTNALPSIRSTSESTGTQSEKHLRGVTGGANPSAVRNIIKRFRITSSTYRPTMVDAANRATKPTTRVKSKSKPFLVSEPFGYRIISDSIGPYTKSLRGNTMATFWMDNSTKAINWQPSKTKQAKECAEGFRKFVITMKIPLQLHSNQLQQNCIVNTDGGSEYLQEFKQLCTDFGIKHEQAAADDFTGGFRSVAESAVRSSKYLMKYNLYIARHNLKNFNFKYSDMWDYALQHGAVQNMLSTTEGITKYERNFRETLTLNKFNHLLPAPWGSLAYVKIPSSRKHDNMVEATKLGLFMGTDLHNNRWLFIDVKTRKQFTSTDVAFLPCDTNVIEDINDIEFNFGDVDQSTNSGGPANNANGNHVVNGGGDPTNNINGNDVPIGGGDPDNNAHEDGFLDVGGDPVDNADNHNNNNDINDGDDDNAHASEYEYDQEIINLDEVYGNVAIVHEEIFLETFPDMTNDPHLNIPTISLGVFNETVEFESVKPVNPVENSVLWHDSIEKAFVLTNSRNQTHGKINPNWSPALLQDVHKNYTIPNTVAEAMTTPEWPKWKIAIDAELSQIDNYGTGHEMTKIEASERYPDLKCINSRLVFKIVFTENGEILKFKVRLCIKGYEQKLGTDFWNTYAAVPRHCTWRQVLSASVQRKMIINQYDIGNAFLEANMDCMVIMRLPKGIRKFNKDGNEYVYVLLKALYGTKQAPSLFHKRYKTFTSEIDIGGNSFVQSKNDPTLFVLKSGTEIMYAINWVDDVIVSSTSRVLMKEYDTKLRDSFKRITGGEQIKWYLKSEFKYDRKRGAMTISQRQLIEKALRAIGIFDETATECNIGAEKVKLIPASDLLNADEASTYRSVVGILMWVFCVSRPDIGYVLIQCSRFVSKPGRQHMNVLIKLCQYMHYTIDMVMCINKGSVNTLVHQTSVKPYILTGASDCGYAANFDLTSNGAYMILDGSNPISWKAFIIKQHAWSTFEGELIAQSELAREVVHCRRICDDLGNTQSKPTILYCDNSATQIHATEMKITDKSKHIRLRDWYVRDCNESGVAITMKCSGDDITVDAMTKVLPFELQYRHVKNLMGGKKRV